MINRFSRFTLLSVLVIATLIACVSADPGFSSVAESVVSTRSELGTSALSAAVFDANRVIEMATDGTQHVGSNMTVSDDAKWHIGSCTKAMTAVVIARLVDRGEIEFETTIGEVFGDRDIHEEYRSVTVAELLRHRGGTTGAIFRSHPEVWQAMWEGITSKERAIRGTAAGAILSDPPSQAPGRYVYSNAGIMVAAVMAETLLDKSWEELIRNELFVPLGMDSAGFGAAAESNPWPHRWTDGAYEAVDPVSIGSDNPPSLGPAGTVHVSLSDWVKFLQVFIDGGPDGYLSAESKSALLEASSNNAAAGWFVFERSWAGGSALNHNGSNTMNYAVAWVAPEKKRGIVIATNGAAPDTARILDRLAGWMVTTYIAPIANE